MFTGRSEALVFTSLWRPRLVNTGKSKRIYREPLYKRCSWPGLESIFAHLSSLFKHFNKVFVLKPRSIWSDNIYFLSRGVNNTVIQERTNFPCTD